MTALHQPRFAATPSSFERPPDAWSQRQHRAGNPAAYGLVPREIRNNTEHDYRKYQRGQAPTWARRLVQRAIAEHGLPLDEQPVTLEGLKQGIEAGGVSVLVAAGADPVRPKRPYRLSVRSAHPLWDGKGWNTLVAIGGYVEKLDGSPTERKFPYRDARVLLRNLSYAEPWRP